VSTREWTSVRWPVATSRTHIRSGLRTISMVSGSYRDGDRVATDLALRPDGAVAIER
jgi:hypothetical protein